MKCFSCGKKTMSLVGTKAQCLYCLTINRSVSLCRSCGRYIPSDTNPTTQNHPQTLANPHPGDDMTTFAIGDHVTHIDRKNLTGEVVDIIHAAPARRPLFRVRWLTIRAGAVTHHFEDELTPATP